MRYTFSIVIDEPAYVEDLHNSLESWIASEASDMINDPAISYEIKEPAPTPGSLALLDAGTIQLVLGILSGSGALTLTLRSLFRVLEKYIDAHKVVIKVKFGENMVEVSGKLSEQERSKYMEEFIQHFVEVDKK
jgi:hypothetical protein